MMRTSVFAFLDGGRSQSARQRKKRLTRQRSLRAEPLEDRRMLAIGWAASIGGSGSDYGEAVATFADGSAVVTGVFEGSINLGGTTLASAGSSDWYIAKVDAGGSYQWAVRAGGNGTDFGSQIAALPDGSAIMTARFSGSVAFGGTTLVASGANDIAVAKVSSSGGFLWAVRAGGVGNDSPAAISPLADGSAVLTGYFSDAAAFGSVNLATTGSQIFVSKINTDGTFGWATSPFGGVSGSGQDIAITADGSAIVTGWFSGIGSFGATLLASNGQTDMFVAKVTPTGMFVWAVGAGGSGRDSGNGVGILPNGSAIVSGAFESSARFGATEWASSGSSDIFVATIDESGGFGFVTRVGGAGYEAGGDISTASDGSLAMSGIFAGTLSIGSASFTSTGMLDGFVARLDPESGLFSWAIQFDHAVSMSSLAGGPAWVTGSFDGNGVIGGKSLTSLGGLDAFVARLDPHGDYAWAVRPGGSSSGLVSSVAALADGSALVTGSFSDSRTFGGTTLTAVGGGSTYVARLNPDGTYAWAVRPGSSGNDSGSHIAVLADGSSVVVGRFVGSATFGGTTLTGVEWWADNVFITKLSPNGAIVWATHVSGTYGSYARGIAVLADGSVLVTGDFIGSLTCGGTTLVSAGNYDIFVAKLNPSGSHAWAVRAGGPDEDRVMGLAAFADGSAAITGTFRNSALFGGVTISTPSGSPAFVARLTAGGSFSSATALLGSVSPAGIAANTDGSAVVAGRFSYSMTVGTTTLVSAGNTDVFATKVDALGNPSWVVRVTEGDYGSSETASAVATQADGSVILAGYFSGITKFGDTMLRNAGPSSPATTDMFVAKLNPNGSHAWATRAGGPGVDYARGVAVGGDGSLFLVGDFTDTAVFGGITLAAPGPWNMFVAKLRGFDFLSLGVKIGTVELGRLPAGYALRVNGRVIPVTTGGSNAGPGGGWEAVLARQVEGGYQLVWKHSSSGGYRAWLLDGAGVRQSESLLTLSQVQAIESQIGLDITGDGLIGTPIPFTSIRRVGAVDFGTTATGYALRVNGRVIQVRRNGVNVSTRNPGGGWVARLGRQSGNGYELIWKNTRTGQYSSWLLTDAGARLSERMLVLPKVWGIETEVNVDLTGEGRIGAAQGRFWWEKSWVGRYEFMGAGSRVEITFRNLGAGPRRGTYRVEYLIRFPGDPPAVVDPRIYLTGEGSGVATVNVSSTFSISGQLAGMFTKPIPVLPNQPPQFTGMTSCSFEIYSDRRIAGSVMGTGYATNWFVT